MKNVTIDMTDAMLISMTLKEYLARHAKPQVRWQELDDKLCEVLQNLDQAIIAQLHKGV